MDFPDAPRTPQSCLQVSHSIKRLALPKHGCLFGPYILDPRTSTLVRFDCSAGAFIVQLHVWAALGISAENKGRVAVQTLRVRGRAHWR